MLKPTLQAIAYTYGYVVDMNIVAFGPHTSIKKENTFLASIE